MASSAPPTRTTDAAGINGPTAGTTGAAGTAEPTPVVAPLRAGGFAAEVTGLDLTRPVGERTAELLRRAFLSHPVLCLRTGGLTPEQLLATAHIFGEPQVQVLREYRRSDHPEISLIAAGQFDRRGDGRRIVFGSHWHTDDSYLEVPAKATMLYARRIPPRGGDTLFTDMYRAYEELPGDLRQQVEGRRAVHTYLSRRNVSAVPTRDRDEEAATPPVEHPLVRTHPETGRPALYLNPNRIDGVVGLAAGDADTLLDALVAHSTAERYIHRHVWRPHDVLLWDNRCTMHKATADYGDEPREMLRILLRGTPTG
jgi:taurine dioxygenase